MGAGGAAYAFALLWKSRSRLRHNSRAFLDSTKHVLFHVSFVFVCPTVWFVASLCPSDFLPGMAFFLLGTMLPVLWTSRALIQHQHEKAADEEAQNSARGGWLHMAMPRWQEAFSPSTHLEEDMKYLLAYWACWPLLCAVQFSFSRLPDKAKPGSEGLLIALAMWLQFWRGSCLAPYLFTLLTSLLSHTIEHLCSILEAGRQAVRTTLQRPTFSLHLLSLCPQERWAMLVAGIFLLVVCLEVASVVSVLITVGLLFGIALESARCVAGNATQMYASRLSFWVLVNVWFWALKIPVLGRVLSLWSPVMFGLAFVAGENAFGAVSGLILHVLALIIGGLSRWCDRCTAEDTLHESLLSDNPAEDVAARLHVAEQSMPAELDGTSERQPSKSSEQVCVEVCPEEGTFQLEVGEAIPVGPGTDQVAAPATGVEVLISQDDAEETKAVETADLAATPGIDLIPVGEAGAQPSCVELPGSEKGIQQQEEAPDQEADDAAKHCVERVDDASAPGLAHGAASRHAASS